MKKDGPDDALDPSSPEEEEDEEDSGSAAEAGVARALVRSLAKLSPNFVTIYRSLFVGQLPRRVPVKSLGVVTDYASTIIEHFVTLRDHHRAAEKEHGHAQPLLKAPKHQHHHHSLTHSLWRKGRVLGKALLSAVPSLAKSALLGTAVFTLYEDARELSDPLSGVEGGDEDPATPALPVLASSFAAGAVAGAGHGVLYTLWELGLGRVKGVPMGLVPSGVVSAHTLSHATLFGSYETIKLGLMRAGGCDHTDPLGVAAVAAAGACAGAAEEAVSSFTVRWEQKGVVSVRQLMRLHGPPPLRNVLAAAPPAALGFLAFEYGRELVLRKAGPEED